MNEIYKEFVLNQLNSMKDELEPADWLVAIVTHLSRLQRLYGVSG